MKWILEVTWDVEGMPPRIGPFDSKDEALEFGRLNVPNGSYNAAPIKHPYRSE